MKRFKSESLQKKKIFRKNWIDESKKEWCNTTKKSYTFNMWSHTYSGVTSTLLRSEGQCVASKDLDYYSACLCPLVTLSNRIWESFVISDAHERRGQRDHCQHKISPVCSDSSTASSIIQSSHTIKKDFNITQSNSLSNQII